MSRFIEFFEGEKSQLSMMRLMVFASFFPATYIAMSIKTTEALKTYLGAYVIGSIGNKVADVVGRGRNAISDKSDK